MSSSPSKVKISLSGGGGGQNVQLVFHSVYTKGQVPGFWSENISCTFRCLASLTKV